jgi:hypothetical protein
MPATPLQTEYTTFTLDNMGRYLCNSLQEALDSANVVIGDEKRDFDVIVIGGGSFGCAIAEALFVRDKTRSRRILVLEQGPFVLPEHWQNLPFLGGIPNFTKPWVNDPKLESSLQYPGLLYAIGGRSLAWGGWAPEPLHDANNDEMINWPAAAIQDLQQTYYHNAAVEIGVAATNDFISGPLQRALRKQLFDALVANPPASLIFDLMPDHPAVREFQKQNGAAPPASLLLQWLDLPATDVTTQADLLKMMRLEAPLAVQATAEPGFFPFNKFSAIPLVIQAARVTSTEADGTGAEADARKRLIVVPSCHIEELITQTQPDGWVRVTGVRAIDRTGGSFDISIKQAQSDGSRGVAILALGTIETTRVGLTTFQTSLAGRAAQRMGENFVAHLRSNLTIRIPKSALTTPIAATPKHIPVAAMFVKGKKNVGGQDRFFHFQITASGLSDLGNNSEVFLFRKVPDAEQVDVMAQADASSIVITIRGIGQMSSFNPDSRVGLAQTPGDIDQFKRPLAYANLGNALAPTGGSPQTQNDRTLWNAMDDFADQIALMFANKQSFEILMKSGTVLTVKANATAADLKQLRTVTNGGALQSDIRDPLGTTHHEAGTMRMSDAPANGVTNDFGRIHDTTNCYVVGPALLPSTGSPNPMLTGVAMARRTADLLTNSVLPKPVAFNVAAPWKALFDGTGVSFNRWVRVSPNNSSGFALIGGEIVTYGTKDFGLLYYSVQSFNNFTLKAQVRVFNSINRNSGIFARFRDPLLELPQPILQRISTTNEIRQDLPTDMDLFKGNRAWGAVYSGFEVQIDDNAEADPRKTFYGPPEPRGLRKNRTGAIYKIPAKDQIPNTHQFDAESQTYNPAPDFRNGSWYEFTIDVANSSYTVDIRDLDLNTSVKTITFQNTDGNRGVGFEAGKPIGFIGLQSHPGSPVAFRNIQIKA